MKTFAVSMALGAILVSTAAQAADQRPTYIAFKPAAKAASQPTPATPVVAKRKALQPGVVIPLVVGLAAAGTGLALIVKDNDDDGVSPQ